MWLQAPGAQWAFSGDRGSGESGETSVQYGQFS